MLVVKALRNIPERNIRKGNLFHLYLVDAHHHMGREGSHQNTPSTAYEFYTLLWFELKKKAAEFLEQDLLLFEPVAITPVNLVERLFELKKSWKRQGHGWLVDRTFVFPYTDDYSSPRANGKPSFELSNERIAGWTTRTPHSARLVGFGRVNPVDAKNGNEDLPLKEIDRCVENLGLRGLKLHPLAQLFIDDIDTDLTKRVVKRAAKHNIPIVFDSRNIKTVTKIEAMVKSIRKDNPSLSKTLKVIIAHCGMSPSDSRLYDALRDPCVYADTSSLHNQDVPLLFENAAERLSKNEWSRKLLFGTDYSFLTVQAIDVILHLLSQEFQGSLGDAQRILGGNAFHLVNRPFSRKSQSRHSKRIVGPTEKGRTKKVIEGLIFKKLEENWNLASLDPMLPPLKTWPELASVEEGGFNGFFLNAPVYSLESENSDLHIWVHRIPGDLLAVRLAGFGSKTGISSLEMTYSRQSTGMSKDTLENTIYVKKPEDIAREVKQLLE